MSARAALSALLRVTLLVSAGCAGAKGASGDETASPHAAAQVQVPPPAEVAPPGAKLSVSAPPVPQSRLTATLRVPLPALAARLEAVLPRTHAEDFHSLTPEGRSPRLQARYRIEREPVTLRLRGERLELSVPVRYWADLRGEVRSPIAIGKRRWYPFASGLTWGTERQPQRLTLRASVGIGIDSKRGLHVDTTLKPLEHGPPPEGALCVQAGIRFCTPKRGLAPMVQAQIDRALQPRLKEAVAALERELSSGPAIDGLWAELGCPLSLSTRQPRCAPPPGDPDDTYLVLSPEQVVLQGPVKHGDALVLRLAVLGGAAVRVGPHPGTVAPALPLPTRGAVADGIALSVQLQVPHAAAARELSRRLSDFSYDAGGGRVLRVRDASVEARVDAAGKPRLLVHLQLSGAVEGGIYLWGTPRYGADSRTLSLGDLDYTLETGDRFVSALEQMNHARFRQALQARAEYPLGAELDALRYGLQAELDGLSLPGVRVAAALKPPSLAQPMLAADRTTLLLSLRGTLELSLAAVTPAVQSASR